MYFECIVTYCPVIIVSSHMLLKSIHRPIPPSASVLPRKI